MRQSRVKINPVVETNTEIPTDTICLLGSWALGIASDLPLSTHLPPFLFLLLLSYPFFSISSSLSVRVCLPLLNYCCRVSSQIFRFLFLLSFFAQVISFMCCSLRTPQASSWVHPMCSTSLRCSSLRGLDCLTGYTLPREVSGETPTSSAFRRVKLKACTHRGSRGESEKAEGINCRRSSRHSSTGFSMSSWQCPIVGSPTAVTPKFCRKQMTCGFGALAITQQFLFLDDFRTAVRNSGRNGNGGLDKSCMHCFYE